MAPTEGIKRSAAVLAGLLFALGASAVPLPTFAYSTARPLASVDVVDRTSEESLVVYEKDGQRFIVGVPGHEYMVRIRNLTLGRILAVTSVDGVNVVTGKTASPAQSGYVINAGDSVEIAGWRRSLSQTSAFYFTDLGDSYAARTGRPRNVGVIGVAVFEERLPLAVERRLRDKIAAHEESASSKDPAPTAAPRAEAQRSDAAGSPTERAAANFASKLGTGFGRDETSYAQQVRFERSTSEPVETIAIRYDRQENLAALGVLPPVRYVDRTPNPFPALRFVPPPR